MLAIWPTPDGSTTLHHELPLPAPMEAHHQHMPAHSSTHDRIKARQVVHGTAHHIFWRRVLWVNLLVEQAEAIQPSDLFLQLQTVAEEWLCVAAVLVHQHLLLQK
jgi:hypothetical protein